MSTAPASLPRRACGPRRRPQRGAATLIVVMLLFFVLSLAAAYASRNLIFEQRTSANQYRSTQSFEAAEAGIEWALTMLNSGRIDASCQPSSDNANDSYRERYLTAPNLTDSTLPTGYVYQRMLAGADWYAGPFMWSACVLTDTGWQCRCPTADIATVSLPAGKLAFAVRFYTLDLARLSQARPGTVRIEVNGCNAADLACLTAVLPGPDLMTQCVSTLCALLSLDSALKSPPIAALTALGSISGPLTVLNQDSASGGIVARSPAAPTSDVTLTGLNPWTPRAQTAYVDASLSALAPDASASAPSLFSTTFGLFSEPYREQPAALQIDCSSACNAAAVNAALAVERGHVVWLRGAGGLTLAGTDLIGSSTQPVLLVIEGPLSMAGTATVHGLVYAKTPLPTTPSAQIDGGRIKGALVSAGDVTAGAGGSGTVEFNAGYLNQLHYTEGSYVRVPGSWRDFP